MALNGFYLSKSVLWVLGRAASLQGLGKVGLDVSGERWGWGHGGLFVIITGSGAGVGGIPFRAPFPFSERVDMGQAAEGRRKPHKVGA